MGSTRQWVQLIAETRSRSTPKRARYWTVAVSAVGGFTPDEAVVPIPARGTSCGELTPGVLSVIRKVSVCGPIDVGENVTVIAQLEPEFRVEPHVLEEIENWVPDARTIEEIDRFPMFVLEKVIVCPAELLFTA